MDDLTATRVKTKSKCDVVTDAIMSMIARGEYRVGDRIPTENELSELFGVSRVTVREAVKRLHTLGLVSIKQGDGTYVNRADMDSIVRPLLSTMVLNDLSVDQLYDARLFVEIGNVRLATRNRTGEEVEQLRALLAPMQATLGETFDSERFSELDTAFHEQIGKMSRNYVLLSTYTTLQDLLHYYIKRTNISRETAMVSFAHHSQIVTYIDERNEYLAGITMEQHVEHAKRALTRQILQNKTETVQ